jgi:hypothetical protein
MIAEIDAIDRCLQVAPDALKRNRPQRTFPQEIVQHEVDELIFR